ncbi:MAG: hypothetical protein HYY48_02550 [Gammaproteobacteria bacterium]|nr:hypothetical protein [Gammaproteobacteria bacterium]
MNFHWYDAAGVVGVIMILIAYFLLQIGRMGALDPRYSLLNLAGALLIVVSLLFDFNLSAFLMEAAWVFISLLGLHRGLASRRAHQSIADRDGP